MGIYAHQAQPLIKITLEMCSCRHSILHVGLKNSAGNVQQDRSCPTTTLYDPL